MPGRVKGDVTTPSLQIDKGVIFEGRCFMEGVAERAAGASMTVARKAQAEIVMDTVASSPPPPPKPSAQVQGAPPPPVKAPPPAK
jgi:hypothetical protein